MGRALKQKRQRPARRAHIARLPEPIEHQHMLAEHRTHIYPTAAILHKPGRHVKQGKDALHGVPQLRMVKTRSTASHSGSRARGGESDFRDAVERVPYLTAAAAAATAPVSVG